MSRERAQPVVRRFVLVTLVLPAAITLIGLVIQLTALPPAPAWQPLLLTVVLGFGLPALFGLSALPSLRRGGQGPGFRLLGAQALGLSVLLTIVTTSLVLQGDWATAFKNNRIWLPLSIGLTVGVAAALAGWYLQPKGSRVAPKRAAAPIDLAPSQRAAWMHTTYLPVPAVVVIIAATTISAVKAGFGWAAGDRDGIAAILSVVALLLLLVLALTVAFRVRVDARGLSVRSVLGIPRFRVAPQEVGAVAVVDARSLGVNGSWGIRIFPSRVTIVMRSTTGIRVTRRDGRMFFVTVEDAATGAALLKAIAALPECAAAESPAPDS